MCQTECGLSVEMCKGDSRRDSHKLHLWKKLVGAESLKTNLVSYGTVVLDCRGYNIKEWKFDCNFPV